MIILVVLLGSLSNDDSDGNEKGEKNAIGFIGKTSKFARALRFLCTFLSRRCTTTMEGFVRLTLFRDGNTWRKNPE